MILLKHKIKQKPMKTKLLKKVRKRYTITYYPKQISLYGEVFKGECMVLRDTVNDYRCVEICNPENFQKWFSHRSPTKEDAKEYLLNQLLYWIKKDYKEYRIRKPNQNVEIIWYNRK